VESVSVSGTLYGDCPRKHQTPCLELSASTIIQSHRDDSRFTVQGECSEN
ncbi:uncharacterized protein B0T23DRAFT_413854, partial [Neurospora hispaniola]